MNVLISASSFVITLECTVQLHACYESRVWMVSSEDDLQPVKDVDASESLFSLR